jgi:uncharacterized damage-inducible protein DinB
VNADDVLAYGHRAVLDAVDGLSHAAWEAPGTCGVWSVKDILAHLASYEFLLVDACAPYLGGGPTPYLDALLTRGETFNDAQVAQRRDQSAAETLIAYTQAQECAASLVARIPVTERRQAGRLGWYGADYDLEDLITYMFYGHKREHCAQIVAVRDRLGAAPTG